MRNGVIDLNRNELLMQYKLDGKVIIADMELYDQNKELFHCAIAKAKFIRILVKNNTKSAFISQAR